MANTHENLEHAEHAEHNAHDPFNQRVAVSMAIVAALLAGVSMVGHRKHNEVLQLQSDANRLRTEAATSEVEKSNLFAWYQAKRLRQSQMENDAAVIELMPGSELLGKDADENAKKKIAGLETKRAEKAADWKKKADEYKQSNKGKDPRDPEGNNLPDLERRGKEAEKRAEELKKDAAKMREDAEHAHHQADRLDLAHLAAELGLVLCSIALLTKKKVFWFTGLGAAVIALGLTVSAYMISHHPHDSAAPHTVAPDGKDKDKDKGPTH